MPSKTSMIDWLTANGMKPTEGSHKDADYVLVFKRGIVGLHLLRISDKKLIRVHGVFAATPEQKQKYSPDMKPELMRIFLQTCAILEVDINLIEETRYGIYEHLYDDGFSFDRLYSVLKRVTLAIHNNLQILSRFLKTETDATSAVESHDPFLDYYV